MTWMMLSRKTRMSDPNKAMYSRLRHGHVSTSYHVVERIGSLHVESSNEGDSCHVEILRLITTPPDELYSVVISSLSRCEYASWC